MKKTALSAGEIIRKILAEDKEVKRIATKVFPVAIDKAILPYVAYRRVRIEHNPLKTGHTGADTAEIEINCYADTYEKSIILAEAVRAALDYKQYGGEEMTLRSCTMINASEAFDSDAYVQGLVFRVQI